MKAKMDELKKAKLIYTIELGVFATAFLVVAILQFVHVINFATTHLRIINWVTIFGSSIGLADFVWFLFSPVRRKKNSMFDKVALVPLMIYILVFDIICFVNYDNPQLELAQIMIPIALCYVALAYSIEAVYHWYVPLPMLLESLEEDKNKNPQEVIDTDVEVVETKEDKED